MTFILRASSERRRGEYERQRAIAHEQAALNSFAYHAPKKLPRYKPIKKAEGVGNQDMALAHARGMFKAWAAKSKRVKGQGAQ